MADTLAVSDMLISGNSHSCQQRVAAVILKILVGLVQIHSIHVHLHTPFVIVYHFVHISSISIHVHAQHNSVEYPYTIAELYNPLSFEEGPQHIRRG